MKNTIILFNIIITTCILHLSVCLEEDVQYITGNNTDVDAALTLYDNYEHRRERMLSKLMYSLWNYKTNLTEHNKREYFKTMEEKENFSAETKKNATSFAWETLHYVDNDAYNWFFHMSKKPNKEAIENDAKLEKVVNDMEDIFGKVKVCSYSSKFLQPCSLLSFTDVAENMRESTNFHELKYYWTQLREETGKKIRNDYLRYIDLKNEDSRIHGSPNVRNEFGIEENYFTLWKTIKPLYTHLQVYMRRKLIEKYPESYIKPDGPIPAHLLERGNAYDLVIPYPNKKSVDVTKTMREKNITALDMFKIAEKFFTSIGLMPMPPEFWNRSIIEKPLDREIVCHATAWNFFNGSDVRIKMCTTVDMDKLATIHHEMGHIEYFLHYKDLPFNQKFAPHAAFHEAIGDMISHSVLTTDYLQKIGLLEEYTEDSEIEINNLLFKALRTMVIPPSALAIDLWRWNIFNGSIDRNDLNRAFWKLRLEYEGICPPLLRTEEDLDAGAVYHVTADVPVLMYFGSIIIQFQFHQALCKEAGHTGPLHKCSIYQNKKAGKLLSDMLKLGSSVSWEKAMEVITKGEADNMDSAAILEYFKPLYNWLKEQNKNEFIGWKSDNPMKCP